MTYYRLFARIKAECKSDANVWKVMSAYYNAFGMRKEFRDVLLRRVRALESGDWERDETKVCFYYLWFQFHSFIVGETCGASCMRDGGRIYCRPSQITR